MSQIKWYKYPNEKTLRDSWLTLKKYYPNHNVKTYMDFYYLYKNNSVIKDVSIKNLNNVLNTRHKINGKCPEDYYTKENSPRGKKDIDSVYYHITTINMLVQL